MNATALGWIITNLFNRRAPSCKVVIGICLLLMFFTFLFSMLISKRGKTFFIRIIVHKIYPYVLLRVIAAPMYAKCVLLFRPKYVCRAIRSEEGQDFLRRIVDNAVTMRRARRIVYRFRHPVTYFPIELERNFRKDTNLEPFSVKMTAEVLWRNFVSTTCPFDVSLFEGATLGDK